MEAIIILNIGRYKLFSFFEEHKAEFTSAFRSPKFRELAESEKFLFQAAKDRLEEFQGMRVGDGVIDGLLNTVRPKPKGFFKPTLYSFDNNSDEYRLLRLIGCIMSYFEMSSPMGKELNERRRLGIEPYIIAKVMPVCLPKSWINYLLKLKLGDDVHSFKRAPGIRNSILYLQDPENNFSIMSDELRGYILRTVFVNRRDVDVSALMDGMRHIGIEAANPLNNSMLCDRILHTTPIIDEWKELKKMANS
jgi:hypothetical protein